MRNKMQQLLSLSEKDYKQMCDNMKEYSKTHNYDEFCNEIISIIEHSWEHIPQTTPATHGRSPSQHS